MSNWPHIESPEDYARFKRAYERGTKELEHLSSGASKGCNDCGLGEDADDKAVDMANEPHFSWRSCDICDRSLGGYRHPAHGVMKLKDGREITVHMDICPDCLYFMEYGQLDDQTMSEIEGGEK